MEGNEKNDRLEGDAGNDRLLGQAGNDRLLGGAGRDRLMIYFCADPLSVIWMSNSKNGYETLALAKPF